MPLPMPLSLVLELAELLIAALLCLEQDRLQVQLLELWLGIVHFLQLSLIDSGAVCR